MLMRVGGMRRLADTVIGVTLDRPWSDDLLPPFEPGAHVDVYLPGGLVRSYSLYTRCDATRRYEIAVNRDRASRGGSVHIHDCWKVGDLVTVSAPRNLFPLADGPHVSVLIAGGIGITPLYCMAQHLVAGQRQWQLAYAARNRAGAAFLDELQALASGAAAPLMLHFDDEAGGKVMDIAHIVRAAPAGAHFYCCGPTPMLNAFMDACAALPSQRVHYERFGPGAAAPAGGGTFEVELARSGKTLHVPADQTVLDALLDAGVEVEYSCMQGICGSCRTRVLAGEPDHRDAFLSPLERASNEVMMICCSRSLGGKLVLDL